MKSGAHSIFERELAERLGCFPKVETYSHNYLTDTVQKVDGALVCTSQLYLT